MDVARIAQSAIQTVSEAEPGSDVRARLQIALLKKALQSQEDQAAELLKVMSGKGQTLDLRV